MVGRWCSDLRTIFFWGTALDSPGLPCSIVVGKWGSNDELCKDMWNIVPALAYWTTKENSETNRHHHSSSSSAKGLYKTLTPLSFPYSIAVDLHRPSASPLPQSPLFASRSPQSTSGLASGHSSNASPGPCPSISAKNRHQLIHTTTGFSPSLPSRSPSSKDSAATGTASLSPTAPVWAVPATQFP